ncbi:hypothetical protein [Aliikangiella coralliicola]|uniref:Uncharacterized protein n=1 Tax=Aliikangiella coralliicola TaxID=2592383 RepID=A0A545UA80_9GAMM|nr:hypothetical protein [Aliikangiella coralliicola]TQV86376.1 hypothetical protein FLL46_15755 [Aliikangiella coralliicola]
MRKLTPISAIVIGTLLSGFSVNAYANGGWTSKEIFNSLDDDCKKKIKWQIGNERSMRGATDHHREGDVIDLHKIIQRGRAKIENECGVVLQQSKKQKGKFKLSWSQSSEMTEIDWS